MMANTDETGWIDWRGGRCPLSRLKKVDVRLRDGTVQTYDAGVFDWRHTSGKNDEGDIMAYREARP